MGLDNPLVILALIVVAGAVLPRVLQGLGYLWVHQEERLSRKEVENDLRILTIAAEEIERNEAAVDQAADSASHSQPEEYDVSGTIAARPEIPDDLGRPLRKFRVSRGHGIVNGLLGMIGVSAGTPLLFAAAGMDPDPMARAIPIIVGLILVQGGIWLLVKVYRNRGTAVTVFQHGLCYTRGRWSKEILWSEISSVAVQEREKSVKVAAFEGLRSATLHLVDGTAIHLGEAIGSLPVLVKMIELELEPGQLRYA